MIDRNIIDQRNAGLFNPNHHADLDSLGRKEVPESGLCHQVVYGGVRAAFGCSYEVGEKNCFTKKNCLTNTCLVGESIGGLSGIVVLNLFTGPLNSMGIAITATSALCLLFQGFSRIKAHSCSDSGEVSNTMKEVIVEQPKSYSRGT